MPTYEYQCPLGHEFEKFQKMNDRARVRCPTCGRAATRRISGGAGLVFKGSGFYITDYGKDGKGPRKPAAESASGGDSASSTEAKGSPKSEEKPKPAKKAPSD